MSPILILNAVLFLAIVVALVVIAFSWIRRTARPLFARDAEGPAPAPRVAAGAGASSRPAAHDGQRNGAAFADADSGAAADGTALSGDEVLRKLNGLALGGTPAADVPAEHVRIAAAIANTVQAAATDPRYSPRRPLLLPQLLRALGDGDTSRRELADIIARDPSLVGGLLKLANSSYYRVNDRPIESVERAVAVLGTQGVRSLVAAALVQPVFRSGGGELGRFPEIVWEHSYRAGAAAEVHAAGGEGADLLAAQLLALVTGLAGIVVFRVATDHYARARMQPDASAIASVLESQTAVVARTIASSWELSERTLTALAEQLPGAARGAESPLGRSLRFGLVAGALSVLTANGAIDETLARASLAAAGGAGPRFERMWERFSRPAE